ncbi:MAG TPA: biotin carboxylase N-terminal domain-containing protein, partial [Nitriliruptorales bacterium]|nr:biotin carboxylase N-terminal domain-containing protein [Nitriliruptorales bacterium]
MFRKVLIANRGEVARRVLRTCHRLGVATVAVYSDADHAAPHVREADEAVRLGPARAAASYLSIERVVDAALRTGADAVHPGYGFLAENPVLAEVCEAKGLTFVGPRPETIRLMADKAAAKRHLDGAGVPVIPWASPEELDDAGAFAAGQRLGYPALVKAVAGGGGVGMRRVDRPEDLPDALVAARAEAAAAFGDPRVMLEALVERPRHVEVQVVGDGHGGVVHMFERECSVQRRHQKIVEECPSPALDEPLRRRMADAAVAAARSVAYRGAGTVEMLLSDVTGDFHFLEMNTRLQVEHPVTELVTGLDLVEWQLRIAAGDGLPLSQDAIVRDGHALEVRLYAEDPARDHLPQTGRVLVVDIPDGPAIRVDAGVTTGSVVGTHYDPLIGKVAVHAATRDAAIRRMAWVLRHTVLLGVTTNVDHLVDVVTHPAFGAGALTTAFLDEHLPDWHPPPTVVEVLAAAAAALLARSRGRGGARLDPARSDPWHTLGPWRVADVGGWRLRLRDRDGVVHDLVVGGRPHHVRLEVAGGCDDVRV